MSDTPLAIHASGLGFGIGGRAILHDVSFSLRPGERLAVIGPSGAGKTSLLRLIAGLATPTVGDLTLAGRTMNAPQRRPVPPEGRNVAMVFQGLALFPHLCALDQIEFAASRTLSPDHRRKLATDLLARVHLGHRGTARLDELSGGERQRVALARALAQRPAILLMDEPFAALDDLTRADMRELLTSLLDETSTTLVLVTHHRDDALALATHGLVISAGSVADRGDLGELISHPSHKATVSTLGLGDLLPATLTSATTAQTALGKVQLANPSTDATPSNTFVLLRPGQVVIDANEADVQDRPPNARILSIRYALPSENGEARATRIARCSLLGSPTEQILHLHLSPSDSSFAPGNLIRLTTRGICHALSDFT